MTSGFLTPGGTSKVPDAISDSELLKDHMWPVSSDGNSIRDATEFLDYGKDNYWTSQDG